MKILDDNPILDYEAQKVADVIQNGGTEGKAAIFTIITLLGVAIISGLGLLIHALGRS